MDPFRVLIVEDDAVISTDLEGVLEAAGCEVCGVAASERAALRMAEATHPPFAVVDVRLSPGDGRVVARELCDRYDTVVLLATAHIDHPEDLAATGAFGCLPKPYEMEDVFAALEVVRDLHDGRPVRRLPDHMVALNRWM
ncbi:MAG: response regulator receiver [Caulobacteraceae bacterium]|nr:response regulator receiver [Caulobacteraceae bacterium]